jgi:hypothetical protein
MLARRRRQRSCGLGRDCANGGAYSLAIDDSCASPGARGQDLRERRAPRILEVAAAACTTREARSVSPSRLDHFVQRPTATTWRRAPADGGVRARRDQDAPFPGST